MRQFWIHSLLILFHWPVSISAKAIQKGPSNETLLVGQLNGPAGGATRNLIGTILSMNVTFNQTVLHSSIIPLTNSTFPIDYSVVLDDHDLSLKNAKEFDILATIWQPVYIFDGNAKLPESDVDAMNIDLRTINFFIVRGEIVHDKHGNDHELPATQVKLELIEEGENGHVVDQVDFTCKSKKYPCPFEYWLDTSRIKGDVNYRLEAILADRLLPIRKSVHQKHSSKLLKTKSNSSKTFKINPTVDTEINDYKITVADAQ